jgi:hypothetical protein
VDGAAVFSIKGGTFEGEAALSCITKFGSTDDTAEVGVFDDDTLPEGVEGFEDPSEEDSLITEASEDLVIAEEVLPGEREDGLGSEEG